MCENEWERALVFARPTTADMWVQPLSIVSLENGGRRDQRWSLQMEFREFASDAFVCFERIFGMFTFAPCSGAG